jgi:UDP-N-acetylglucosamine diphosphorylase/glucosamine-1-phosphate N-acetyltransferase
MRVCLFEDATVEFLEPLNRMRPTFELRAGAVPLRQRQQRHFAAFELGAIVRPYLAELTRAMHPGMPVNDGDWLAREATVLVNARWLPAAAAGPPDRTPHVGLQDRETAYIVLPADQMHDVDIASIDQRIRRWSEELPTRPCDGVWVRYPWDLINQLERAMVEDSTSVVHGANWHTAGPDSAVAGPPERVHVHSSAVIEPYVVLDSTRGPIVIDENAMVQAFTRIEGPAYIGSGSIILGAKIRQSSIGTMCRIGGEVEASIIHGYSNKYHDGFLGHSYVGEWVNLGAGTQTSDLRNDYGPVKLTVNGQRVDSGQSKVGSFIGDHTKTGLGTLFNTGTVVGPFCNLLPSGELMPRTVPAFSLYSRGKIAERDDWRQLLTTTARVMQRRGQDLSDTYKHLINAVFERTRIQRAVLKER